MSMYDSRSEDTILSELEKVSSNYSGMSFREACELYFTLIYIHEMIFVHSLNECGMQIPYAEQIILRVSGLGGYAYHYLWEMKTPHSIMDSLSRKARSMAKGTL